MIPAELFENPKTIEESVIDAEADHVVIDRIEYGEGIQMYIKGHPFPQKGLPTQEAIFAVNLAKRLCIESLRLFGILLLLVSKKRALSAFNRIVWGMLSTHILKYEYLTPTAQEVYNIVLHVTGNEQTSKILAHIIEYDAAYRFRLMDLCSETSKEQLIKNPRKKIGRLLAIHKERDYKEITDKFSIAGKLLLFALLLPKFRKTFTTTLRRSHFQKLQYDEADRYWACYKTDYQSFGKSFAERQELLKQYDK